MSRYYAGLRGSRHARILGVDMLLEQGFLDALVAGEVDLAFRRWAAPRVKVGTRMRTSHGLVEELTG